MQDAARIMVVDDEVRMCDSLSKLLGAEGYDVTTYVDPQLALAALKEERAFDCVLTDIKMPGTDGLEILRQSRDHDPWAPVILMTGYASLDSAVEAVNHGAYDYLLKPIEFPQLKLSVQRGLAQRRADLGRLDLLRRLSRQNRWLRERLKELRALHLVGVSISSARPLTAVLEQLLEGATQVTRAEQGSLMLLDEESGELTIRAARGLPEEVIRQTRLKLSEGISGYVAQTGEPVRVANVSEDPRFARTPHPRYESSSFLSVPLKISDRILGVLNVSSRQGGGVFRARDLRLLTIFATQAAAVIDDAYLFERNRQKLDEQRVLYHIAREVASAERFEQVAGAIYASLKEIMPLDFGLWLGWNEVRNVLHYRFVRGEQTDAERWADFEHSLDQEVWQQEAQFNAAVYEAVTAHPAWSAEMSLLIILPIRLEDRPRGAMVLGSIRTDRLTSAQEQIAAIAGSQAAAVYERHQDALNTTRLATMGNMISEIAHDLKKPLTNLKGSLQILRQNYPQLGEGNRFLESAEQEIHHLGELVRELVDFSNPGRYPLDRVSLQVPLERALSLIASETERRRLRLVTDLAPQAIMVRGQESEMVQALLNILHNAMDSMSEGGQLDVATRVEVPEGQTEDYAAVLIRDVGCGIPDEEHHRVFARHFTTKEGGSGLGLAIVERIMKAHNGLVTMDSQPGKGTQFILYFPLAR